MKIRINGFRIFLVLLFLHMSPPVKPQDMTSDSRKTYELVKTAWNILDSCSSTLYPYWKNYRQYPVFIGLPDCQGVFINPNKEPPPGYRLIKTDTTERIYVRDSSGVGYAGSAVGIKIGNIYYPRYLKVSTYNREFNDDYVVFLKKYFGPENVSDSLAALVKSPDYFVSIFIHEAFHIFEQSAKRLQRTKDIRYLKPDIAALSFIEGCLLSEALEAESDEMTREEVKKFIAIRKYKSRKLSRRQVNYEEDYEWLEGGSTYIQAEVLYRMLSPANTKLQKYLDKMNLLKSAIDLNEPDNKIYYYGEAQIYLLEKLKAENWKTKVLERNLYFVNLLEEAVKYDKKKEKEYERQVMKTYGYPEMKKKLRKQFEQKNYFIEHSPFYYHRK